MYFVLFSFMTTISLKVSLEKTIFLSYSLKKKISSFGYRVRNRQHPHKTKRCSSKKEIINKYL